MNFKRLLIITAISLFYFPSIFAQSLKDKIDSLNKTAFNLRVSDRELSNSLAKKALNLNSEGKYAFGVMVSTLNLGINYTNLSQYDSAFTLLRQCDDYFENDFESGLTKYYIGVNFSNIRNFKNAIRYFEQANTIFKKFESHEFLAQVQNSLGIIEGKQGNYNESLTYFLKAYQIRLSNDLPYDQELTNISIVYRFMGEFEKSLEFVRKSLQMSIELNDTLGITQNYISLGQSFKSMNSLDSALYYYDIAYSLAESKQYTHQISSVLLYKANLLNINGRNEDAIRVLLKLLSIKNIDEEFVESIFTELAFNYYEIQLNDSALYYAWQGYNQSLEADNLKLQESLSLLISNIFYDQVKLDSAIKYLQIHNNHMKDLNERSNESLNSDLRVRIETLEKDHEISLLNKENELETLKVERLVIGIISLVILIIALIIWFRSRSRTQELQRKKLEMELEKGNEDLYKQTLHMIHVNNCLDDIEKEVIKRNEKDIALSNKRIMNTIKSNKSLDKDWKNFNEYFSAVHTDFDEKFSQLSDDLTIHDRRVCALLKLELSNREIAIILNIEPKSVSMVKYRIKKKLNISEELELDNFIRRL